MDETMAALADGIRRAREAAGYSQREVGRLAEIDPHILSGAERGERKPRADTLRKLARVLGVSVSELYGEPAPGTAPGAEWAFTTSQQGFNRWLERADLDAILKLLPQMTHALKELPARMPADERHKRYRRTQRVIREWTRRVGPLRVVDRELVPDGEKIAGRFELGESA